MWLDLRILHTLLWHFNTPAYGPPLCPLPAANTCPSLSPGLSSPTLNSILSTLAPLLPPLPNTQQVGQTHRVEEQGNRAASSSLAHGVLGSSSLQQTQGLVATDDKDVSMQLTRTYIHSCLVLHILQLAALLLPLQSCISYALSLSPRQTLASSVVGEVEVQSSQTTSVSYMFPVRVHTHTHNLPLVCCF